MAKAEITPGIIGPSKEEVESLTGKGAKEGLVPWIPRRLKIEWLYRLLRQPWRLRRQLALLKFVILVFKQKLLK